ncbi:(S)-ureidoglycine aminohydrolase [Puia sp.]|jgi:(S)-ureidoglycine aminohydrolase|uniref:(S)-ureidoglycine aminohydrolase n=1 Tax=Puia sp. TaxID=2045100 RepID=UPI002F3E97E7
MEISAQTRSVVKKNHALISPDGYINSNVPGWKHCTVNVIISKEMGARFSQTLITCQPGATLTGQTRQDQTFFYVVSGSIKATLHGIEKNLTTGHYVYIPEWQEYHLSTAADGTQLLSFHKVYEPLEDAPVPNTLFGDAATIPANEYLGDPALRLQVLLPDDLGFDMAVNVFTYDPGGHLPLVETHIMEHGLLYLRGQGVYRLDQDWYPVKKGDCIWMAPYCQQWFTAMGKEPAVYIYYKNVNRFPY